MNQPAHCIEFGKKHTSDENTKMYRISTTCQDQSFFSAFLLNDHSVNIYLMNFKKGSTITKERLTIENKKSEKIINGLPSYSLYKAAGVERE